MSVKTPSSAGQRRKNGNRIVKTGLIALFIMAVLFAAVQIGKGMIFGHHEHKYRKAVDISGRPSDEFTAVRRKFCHLEEDGVFEVTNVQMIQITNTSKTERLDFDVQFQFMNKDGSEISDGEYFQDHVKISGVPPGMSVLARGYTDQPFHDSSFSVTANTSKVVYSLGDVSIDWSDDFNKVKVTNNNSAVIENLNLILVYETDEWIATDVQYQFPDAGKRSWEFEVQRSQPDMTPVFMFICVPAE